MKGLEISPRNIQEGFFFWKFSVLNVMGISKKAPLEKYVDLLSHFCQYESVCNGYILLCVNYLRRLYITRKRKSAVQYHNMYLCHPFSLFLSVCLREMGTFVTQADLFRSYARSNIFSVTIVRNKGKNLFLIKTLLFIFILSSVEYKAWFDFNHI